MFIAKVHKSIFVYDPTVGTIPRDLRGVNRRRGQLCNVAWKAQEVVFKGGFQIYRTVENEASYEGFVSPEIRGNVINFAPYKALKSIA